MPPSDRLSGALSIASTVIGIASGLQGLGAFGKASESASKGFQTLNSLSSIGTGALGLTGINEQLPITVGGGVVGLDQFYDPFTGGVGA